MGFVNNEMSALSRNKKKKGLVTTKINKILKIKSLKPRISWN